MPSRQGAFIVHHISHYLLKYYISNIIPPEQAERYDDMAASMKSVTEAGAELSNEVSCTFLDVVLFKLLPLRRGTCSLLPTRMWLGQGEAHGG